MGEGVKKWWGFLIFCGGEKVGKFNQNAGIFQKIDLATLPVTNSQMFFLTFLKLFQS